MAVEGGTTSRVFETYIERVLAPALRPGQVVMDKLGAHRPERIRSSSRPKDASLLPAFLLSRSRPDRGGFRQGQVHPEGDRCQGSKGSLIEAMGRALGAVSSEDVRGFFAHCGYRVPRRSDCERHCQEECVEGSFSEVRVLPGDRTLGVDRHFRLAVDRGVKRDHHPDRRAGVSPNSAP
jgi:hypothetical protein